MLLWRPVNELEESISICHTLNVTDRSAATVVALVKMTEAVQTVAAHGEFLGVALGHTTGYSAPCSPGGGHSDGH